MEELERLRDARRRMRAPGRPDASSARLALFTATGFDAALKREAARLGDLHLVDLKRLYEGD